MGTRLFIDWACHIFDKYLDARKSAESKVLKIHSATPPKNGLNAPAEPEKIQPSKLAEK